MFPLRRKNMRRSFWVVVRCERGSYWAYAPNIPNRIGNGHRKDEALADLNHELRTYIRKYYGTGHLVTDDATETQPTPEAILMEIYIPWEDLYADNIIDDIGMLGAI